MKNVWKWVLGVGFVLVAAFLIITSFVLQSAVQVGPENLYFDKGNPRSFELDIEEHLSGHVFVDAHLFFTNNDYTVQESRQWVNAKYAGVYDYDEDQCLINNVYTSDVGLCCSWNGWENGVVMENCGTVLMGSSPSMGGSGCSKAPACYRAMHEPVTLTRVVVGGQDVGFVYDSVEDRWITENIGGLLDAACIDSGEPMSVQDCGIVSVDAYSSTRGWSLVSINWTASEGEPNIDINTSDGNESDGEVPGSGVVFSLREWIVGNIWWIGGLFVVLLAVFVASISIPKKKRA